MSFLRFLFLVLSIFCHSSFANNSYLSASGKNISFDELRGRWVYINYWASWCEMCIKEIPELNDFAKNYQDRAVLIGVNYDFPNIYKLKKLIKKFKIDYISLVENPKKFLNIKDLEGVPMTFVINPQGKLAAILKGPQTQRSLSKFLN